MSGQLLALKNSIKSVESTRKITRAMEMISAAKLNRYQDMMSRGKAYAESIEKLLARLSRNETLTVTHPFLEKREEKKIGLVLITSDMGLCGSYNLELVNRAGAFLEECGKPTTLIGIGKFGIRFMKRSGRDCYQTFTELKAAQIESAIAELKKTLEDIYTNGKADAIYAIYSRCLSKSSYEFALEKILPLENPAGDDLDELFQSQVNYIFEPNENVIFKRLVPLYFEARVRQIFLEAFVSEQIARMQAMHLATQNASEMIDRLVIQRNKIRQAAITREIIEVVSGSQALKIK
jgi:F-type H+-transporting ATPase subunit gamma